MKYELMIRSRPIASVSYDCKHSAFMKSLVQLGGKWGLDEDRVPVIETDDDDDFFVQVNMNKLIAPSVKGEVVYQFRSHLRDEGVSDDYLALEFDPKKVDYKTLSLEIFIHYASVFGAYRGHLGPLQFRVLDFHHTHKLDLRRSVSRIYPITFFDNDLCLRSFAIPASQVVERLKSHVEDVRLISSGVLIVASSQIMSINEAEALNERILPILTP